MWKWRARTAPCSSPRRISAHRGCGRDPLRSQWLMPVAYFGFGTIYVDTDSVAHITGSTVVDDSAGDHRPDGSACPSCLRPDPERQQHLQGFTSITTPSLLYIGNGSPRAPWVRGRYSRTRSCTSTGWGLTRCPRTCTARLLVSPGQEPSPSPARRTTLGNPQRPEWRGRSGRGSSRREPPRSW